MTYSRHQPLYVVDAFVGEGLSGNPAAVCPLSGWLPDDVMQAVAREMDLSETAFFVPQGDEYGLRWFTPTVEAKLCGHATLASAAVFFDRIAPAASAIDFESPISGPLGVKRRGDLLELDFPARPAAPRAIAGVAEAFDVKPAEILAAVDYVCLVVFDDEAAVRRLRPDMEKVAALPDVMVIVTAPGDASDFVSRVFVPRAGIPEDPVTGSAHTTLAPYWSARLGKKSLHGIQVSARGGELFCEDRGDRIAIAGRAVIRQSGRISLDSAPPRPELATA